MSSLLNIKRNLMVFGIPFTIIAMLVFLTKSSVFATNPTSLSIGITFDLLLTVPLIYFLLIRKTNIPKTTVVPVLIICTVVGSFILPAENQSYLSFFKTWGIPIVELSVLAFVLYNIRKAIKQFKVNKNESFDFFTTLKSTCYNLLPKAFVIPVVTEIGVFYYGFIYWKKRLLKGNEFSYHRHSGSITLLMALIFIIAIETVTLHVLLARWSITAAWILTFLSIYSGIQIFGFLKSMYKRPISIENNILYLRYGIMTESIIDIKNIDAVELTSKDIELNKETRKLSFLGALESHNVVIRLKNKGCLTGLYGIKKTYKVLALYVDDKNDFRNQIYKVLKQ